MSDDIRDGMTIEECVDARFRPAWSVYDEKTGRYISGPYRWRWVAVVVRFFSIGLAR